MNDVFTTPFHWFPVDPLVVEKTPRNTQKTKKHAKLRQLFVIGAMRTSCAAAALTLASTLLLSVLLVSAGTAGHFGVDVAVPFSSEQLSCLRTQHNVSFAIVRAHHSWGGVDTNAPQTIQAAWKAGLSAVDVYLFPCTSNSLTAAMQVNTTIDFLLSEGAKYGRIWFDLEWNFWPSACSWRANDPQYNCDFVASLVEAGRQRGAKMGVYTIKSFWNEYMPNCTAASSLPLWFPRWDGISPSNFSDYEPFGGWARASMKQYNNTVGGACNVNGLVDADWSPLLV